MNSKVFMNSKNSHYKVFMNSKNSKTSDPHRLSQNLQIKFTAFTIHGKIQRSHTKIINLKYQLRHGMSLEFFL